MNLATVAGRAEEKIERIDNQIAQLVAHKNELEEQQSLNQSRSIFVTFFFQAPPSLAFKIESIRLQIDSLDKDWDSLYAIIKQRTASTTPEPVDFSDSPFFSKTLDKLNFEYKEQLMLYITCSGSIVYFLRTSYRQRYFLKAQEALRANTNLDDIATFVYRSGYSREHIKDSLISRGRKLGPLAPALAAVGSYVVWVQLTSRRRLSKLSAEQNKK